MRVLFLQFDMPPETFVFCFCIITCGLCSVLRVPASPFCFVFSGVSCVAAGYRPHQSTNRQPIVLQVSVLVKNTGSKAGDHSVLLFATDLVRRVEPRYKLLKGFDKVRLEPGEAKKVQAMVWRVPYPLGG